MFRYYDPARGRWLNRDPIGYSGGMNLYGYCASGPVGWTDPSGLMTQRAAEAAELAWLAGNEAAGIEALYALDAAPTLLEALVGALLFEAAGWVGRQLNPDEEDPCGSGAFGIAASSKLRRNMIKDGVPLGPNDDAEHIVAKNAAAAQRARDVLRRFGIDIDDTRNGTGSPRPIHQGSHTEERYRKINDALDRAQTREQVENLLKKFGKRLSKGGFLRR